MNDLNRLLARVRACRDCENLPLGPRPVLQAGRGARVLIVGQAPGARVHETGVPWDDASGERLREWMQVDRESFYDASRFAIVPVGLCYPGRGGGGDMPPRPECAPKWHPQLAANLPAIELTILCGRYAQNYYLGRRSKATLAKTVKSFRDYGPEFMPLPHPSPRNTHWFQTNPWLEQDVLPALRRRLAAIFG